MSYVTAAHRRALRPDLLTADEEVVLAGRIEAGVLARAVLDGRFRRPTGATDAELEALVTLGEQAWDRFLAANLGLVALLAAQACERAGMDFDELFQEGCVGLADALLRFDAQVGVRFSTYAARWVRNAIGSCSLRRGGRVEASVWQVRTARDLRRRRTELEARLGRGVDDTELARHVGRDVVWVQQTLLLDQPAAMAADLSFLPVACEASGRALEVVLDERPRWLDDLDRREAEVLSLRFGIDDGLEHDYDECARRLRMSVSTVRRAERSGLVHARELLSAGALQAA